MSPALCVCSCSEKNKTLRVLPTYRYSLRSIVFTWSTIFTWFSCNTYLNKPCNLQCVSSHTFQCQIKPIEQLRQLQSVAYFCLNPLTMFLVLMNPLLIICKGGAASAVSIQSWKGVDSFCFCFSLQMKIKWLRPTHKGQLDAWACWDTPVLFLSIH